MEKAADRLDLPSAQLGRYANDRNVPAVDFIAHFTRVFSRVDPGWLATGRGLWEAVKGTEARDRAIAVGTLLQAAEVLRELARDTDPNDSRHVDRPTEPDADALARGEEALEDAATRQRLGIAPPRGQEAPPALDPPGTPPISRPARTRGTRGNS